jgi:spore coat polysaccharide biosynthesis predicted glycosyltransferase SpsG
MSALKQFPGRPFREWVDEVFGHKRPRLVAFRVDASRKEGLSYGHAARCLLMARAVEDLGSKALFVMYDYPDGVDYVASKGFEVRIVQERERFTETLNIAARRGADWLVVDVPYPGVDLESLELADGSGFGVIFMDDFRFVFPDVDVVINSSVRALDKAESKGKPGKLLLGPSYFIFQDFPSRQTTSVEGCDKVIMTFGGSDPTGLTAKVVGALSVQDWPGIDFTVVLGPGYQGDGELVDMVDAHSSFNLLRAPQDLIGIMAGHDLVVCAGGRTMYEAWLLGLPFLPVASAEHESLEIKVFLEHGIIGQGLPRWNGEEFLSVFDKALQDYGLMEQN